jgi:hypothetical protein
MNVIFEESFGKLLGVPAWSVKQGYGSFLTLEFGQPCLEIGEVRSHKARPEFPATRSRPVHVHGEWHLWIYCCSWTIQQEEKAIADSESSRELIQVACNILDGQSLRSVEIVPSTGKTEFTFDLGAVLETGGVGHERTDTSWMLFRPDRFTFSYRSDGYYSLAPSSTGSSAGWNPIPDA